MASAAPAKTVPTNGPRKKADYKFKNPRVDALLDSLRVRLKAYKEAHGIRFIDISRKMRGTSERQYIETVLHDGGFRALVGIAAAMDLRLTIEIHED